MKFFTSIICMICFVNFSQAQLLERLADKATKAAERTVERKVEQKAQKETEKAFDSTFNKKRSKTSKNRTKANSTSTTPKDVYKFTHKYIMQMESDKYNTTITYYLAKNESYFGSTIKGQTSMINVMDFEAKTLFMFTNTGATKMVMGTSLDFEELASDTQNNDQATITKTGKTKTILGYTCSEYHVTSKNIDSYVWVTQKADVSFPKSFYSVKSKNQQANQQWMSNVDGLVLEMQITDTSKRKPETITMRCVTLEKTSFQIKSSDYKKLL